MISLQRTHYYSVNEYHQNVFVHVANQCLSSLKDHVHVHQIPKTQCQIAKLNLKIAKLIPETLKSRLRYYIFCQNFSMAYSTNVVYVTGPDQFLSFLTLG